MSTRISNLFGQIPKTLRSELIEAFNSIESNYQEHRWEPSELNGGKLCEIVYSIINGFVIGEYPQKASKPRNMVDACKNLEKAGSSIPRSLRIQIPRILIALYEIRNNRGVGHVGGDVNPNEMDAICVLHMSKWVISELIRVFHDVNIEDATRMVSFISQRKLPIVWQINGKCRVLDAGLSMKDKTLVLLYVATSGLQEKDLVKNLEHTNPSVYRRDILRKVHKQRLLEYDKSSGLVTISPLGANYVEERILK